MNITASIFIRLCLKAEWLKQLTLDRNDLRGCTKAQELKIIGSLERMHLVKAVFGLVAN